MKQFVAGQLIKSKRLILFTYYNVVNLFIDYNFKNNCDFQILSYFDTTFSSSKIVQSRLLSLQNFTMSKNLIISKLNKCSAYNFKEEPMNFENSTSKVSTSTKTQQSPTIHILNPEFTFKASDFKSEFNTKQPSKAQQYFNSFDDDNQLIYQKVILIRPKMIERSLEFQLMNLYRQGQTVEKTKVSKKLQYHELYVKKSQTVPIQQSIQIRESINRLPEYIKTQYSEPKQFEYKENLNQMNIPSYNCSKYKIHRQKPAFKQQSQTHQLRNYQRCVTQSDCPESYSLLNSNVYRQKNPSKQLNDYEYDYQMKNLKNQQMVLNNYYFENKKSDYCEETINVLKEATNQMTKRQGNSSRLSFFRKQRQNQFRKSLLQDFNDSKKSNFNSYDNKENIQSTTKPIDRLAFNNNISQAGHNKLRNQYSQRYLLSKRSLQLYPEPNKNQYLKLKPAQSSYLNKETENRLQSIRKQLKEIYQVKQNEKPKLKIMRDHDMYDKNSKNPLRKVGSIAKF